MDTIRFALYEHYLELERRLITKYFVVIKDENNILAWTDFHKYISSNIRIKRIESEDSTRYRNIVKFLNYLFFEKYINALPNLSVENVKDFLNDYGLCRLKDGQLPHS